MKKNMKLCGLVLAILLLAQGSAVAYASDEGTGQLITFEEGQAISEGEGVILEGTTVTITAAGTYTLTGACSQGQVVVDCSGEVILSLENLTLSSVNGPVLDIRNARQVTLLLPGGTQSALSDSADYSGAADGQDAAVFSRADLVISGEGALTVYGLYNDAIASRDTLQIEGGGITVQAKNHGIKGKDYLLIEGGIIDVTAGGDGIKATNTDQAELGYVQIDDGSITIDAQDDGISAVSHITINGGVISITTANNGMKSDGALNILSGKITILTGDDDFVAQTESISPEADITVKEQ